MHVAWTTPAGCHVNIEPSSKVQQVYLTLKTQSRQLSSNPGANLAAMFLQNRSNIKAKKAPGSQIVLRLAYTCSLSFEFPIQVSYALKNYQGQKGSRKPNCLNVGLDMQPVLWVSHPGILCPQDLTEFAKTCLH